MTVVGYPVLGPADQGLPVLGPITDKGGQVYNVKAYGADPTGVTDSTTAIQGLITALGVAGGGAIYFPAGTYKITAALVLAHPNVRVIGAGRRITVISQATSNVPILQMAGSITYFLNVWDLTLTYATPQVAANTGAIALQFGDGTNSATWFHCDFSRLDISNAQTGLAFGGGGTSLSLWGSNFEDILFATISSCLIYLIAGAGSPISTFKQIKHINGGTGEGTTWAVNLTAMESAWEALDIEDWVGGLFQPTAEQRSASRACILSAGASQLPGLGSTRRTTCSRSTTYRSGVRSMPG